MKKVKKKSLRLIKALIETTKSEREQATTKKNGIFFLSFGFWGSKNTKAFIFY